MISQLWNWPAERTIRTLHRTGNCVAASIPITLCEGVHSGRIQRGDTVMLCGTGAGLSGAVAILTF